MQATRIQVALVIGWMIPCPALWAAQAFQESSGQVVMEAESYNNKIARNSKDWTLQSAQAGYAGTGYLAALPNTGTTQNSAFTTSSPELVYTVKFTTTGTYHVWIRGFAPSVNDDSAHAGLDGVGPSSADRMTSFPASWTWSRSTMDTATATLMITTPGIHTIHVWMREDGFLIDRLLLRTDGSATAPSGTGPAESTRVTLSDSTPPTTPGKPTEGGSSDTDFDDNGSYSVYWTAAADAESGISNYEVQERIGASGAWTSLTTTSTATSFPVSGRAHNITYFYRVRAKNTVGLWGAWSADSDGVLVDTTAPSSVTVTDDGATTSSTTQLHAQWNSSADPESGVTQYSYRMLQDSTTGTVIVGWTSVGLNTEVAKTGITLIEGKTYYVAVRSKNGAGTDSATAYSDGITVNTDVSPPTGSVTINGGAGATNNPQVTLTLSAADNSGTVSSMCFANDGATWTCQAYAPSAPWTLTSGDGLKTVSAKFSDAAGNWSAPVSDSIVLDTTAPAIAITSPIDGAVIVAP